MTRLSFGSNQEPEWRRPTIAANDKSYLTLGWSLTGLFAAALIVPVVIGAAEFAERGAIGIGSAAVMVLLPIGMAVYMAIRTRRWARFGRVRLTLDPHPGAIGGDVGDVTVRATPTMPDSPVC